jgi:endonuclease YncB( thermonuclease family)
LAFAQTSTTTTEETTTSTRPTTTETTTSTTYETGTVTTYEPGKTIVVRGEQGPVSFALGTAANIVDAAGKAVTAPLRSGQRVRVYYTGPVEHRTVERVLVEEKAKLNSQNRAAGFALNPAAFFVATTLCPLHA